MTITYSNIPETGLACKGSHSNLPCARSRNLTFKDSLQSTPNIKLLNLHVRLQNNVNGGRWWMKGTDDSLWTLSKCYKISLGKMKVLRAPC